MSILPLTDVVSLSETLCVHPIAGELKYATEDNFIGRPLEGYSKDASHICLLMPEVALQLCKVQNDLLAHHNLGLIIYDAYRPKRAVMDMCRWSFERSVTTLEAQRQLQHYPALQKSDLFKMGYIAMNSQHCYGYAVDVFLYNPDTAQPLNMGAIFDHFGQLSHISNTAQLISPEALVNRQIMAKAMQKFGFLPYENEFWHFSCQKERLSQAFDEPITRDFKGLGVAEALAKISNVLGLDTFQFS